MNPAAVDTFFWFCALAGSGLFVVQLILSLLMGDGDDSSAADAGKVKWLSRQAVTGFLMLFGWAALTCTHQFALGLVPTVALATAAGGVTVVTLGLLFKGAKKLHSTGTVFRLEEALGKEAVVYQRISQGGAGKVSLSLHGLTHEIEALSLNGEELSSFTQVQVVKIAEGGKLVVAPITK